MLCWRFIQSTRRVPAESALELTRDIHNGRFGTHSGTQGLIVVATGSQGHANSWLANALATKAERGGLICGSHADVSESRHLVVSLLSAMR